MSTLLNHVTYKSPDEFDIAVAKGYVPGWTKFKKFGHNPDIDAGTEDVWSTGGTLIWKSTAAVVSIVSTSVQDKGTATAGTGIRTVQIEGLDLNHAQISEVVTLNGTTAVTTTKSYLHINRMYGLTCGTSLSNVGTISASITGNVQASIVIGEGQTLKTHYCVPTGYTLIINFVGMSTGRIGNFDLHARLQQRAHSDTSETPWRTQIHVDVYEGSYTDATNVYLFPEKTEIRGVVTTDANNVSLGIEYGGYLVDNRYFPGGS